MLTVPLPAGAGEIHGKQTGENVSLGEGTLNDLTTGVKNTAIGYRALYKNQTGHFNTAIGYKALYKDTTGGANTAIGTFTLLHNTKGKYNTASGYGALNRNTKGNDNTASGRDALRFNTTGGFNTAIGSAALWSNSTGKYNIASGANALRFNTTGRYNTALGANSGYNNVAGSSNVFIGYKAGYNEKGSQKLYIANSARSPLVYGDFNQNTLKVNGKMYATKFITSSDARLKTDIKPLNNALDSVLSLQGKQYRLINEAVDQADIGLIAQDVEKVLPQIVSETEDGYKAIDYQSLTAVLIEAIREQQGQMTTQQQQFTAEITALQKENTELKALVEGQMEALLARVAMLEGESLAAN
tara:strand:+ start:310 stop:1380 length:1071 start_codon:yes stop_codon:yes gene_type:complete